MSRALVGAVALVGAIALAGCAVPHRQGRLPERGEARVAVVSGAMPEPLEDIARHAWIVASVPGEASYRRWELGYSGRSTTTSPLSYFGHGEIAIHGVVRGSPDEIESISACLDRSTRSYRARHPQYVPIPGPNSNTIVAEALRACDVHVELPASAIGRDYLGLVGAARTEGGTGVQVETWPLGIRLGLREGVEAHVLGLALGLHAWPPGITLPINPAGRAGIDLEEHVAPDPAYVAGEARRARDEERDADKRPRPEREIGTGVGQMWLRGAAVRRPSEAGGLRALADAGLSARGVWGDCSGWAFGLDLELGGAAPAGLVYGGRLYPAGLGVLVGDTGYLALMGGVGVFGVTGSVPAGFELPAEARVELDVTRRARVGARANVVVLPTSDDPRRRSALWPLVDELSMAAYARPFGGTRRRAGSTQVLGHGWFFGLERREILGSYWLGAIVGAEIDGAD